MEVECSHSFGKLIGVILAPTAPGRALRDADR